MPKGPEELAMRCFGGFYTILRDAIHHILNRVLYALYPVLYAALPYSTSSIVYPESNFLKCKAPKL